MGRLLKYCEICNKLIIKEKNKNWNEYAKKKYCSKKCSGISQRNKLQLKCLSCKKTFLRHPSFIRGKNNFCSRKCRSSYARYKIVCKNCGKKFIRNPKSPNNKYCSRLCYTNYSWKIVKCFECGRKFKKRICEISKAKINNHKHMCSRLCRNKYTSKYLGGDGILQNKKYNYKRYRGHNWSLIRKQVKERDNFECQQCFYKKNLEVHHWEPFQISFNNDPENLITLCKECHKEKHIEYIEEELYEDLQNEGFWG